MDIKKLQIVVINALEDIKAQEIQVFDTTGLTSLFDRLIIASGSSNRQTKALAASVRDKAKESGAHIISMEGEETGEWVLVDMGDIIVHIMQPAIRAYYRLEEIWGEKEIALSTAKRATAKKTATESTAAAPKKASTRKPKAPAEATTVAKKTTRTTRTTAAKTSTTEKNKAAKPPAKRTSPKNASHAVD